MELSKNKQIAYALLLLIGCHIVAASLTSLWGLLFIGAVQLVYVIPLCIVYYIKKLKIMMHTTIIAAAIVFLLNAACFGLVLGSF